MKNLLIFSYSVCLLVSLLSNDILLGIPLPTTPLFYLASFKDQCSTRLNVITSI